MNIINKLTVKFTPSDSTTKVKFYEVDVLKFNDGSIRVSIPEMTVVVPQGDLLVSMFVESMNDLMIVAQIKDIVNRHQQNVKTIFHILGTPYTRYDRPMMDNMIDGFGAKVFASFVNSMNFDEVILDDAHSEVILSLIDRSYEQSQGLLVDKTVLSVIGTQCSTPWIIAPDKGATKKNPYARIVCDKVRDPNTGKIKGVELVKGFEVIEENIKSDYPKNFLVIDDICEGGRTFIGVAEAVNPLLINSDVCLDLYITHGIFSNNAITNLLEYYDNIYVYMMKESVYNNLHQSKKYRVFPYNLVKDI